MVCLNSKGGTILKESLKVYALVICDIFLINLSILISFALRFDGDFIKVFPSYIDSVLQAAVVATIIKVGCFIFFKLYSSLWKYASIYEMISLLVAAFAGNVLMFGYALLPNTRIPRSIFLIAFFTDAALIGGIRFAYRVMGKIKNGAFTYHKNYKRILVIGGGKAGAIVINELVRNPEMKSTPVAIIDDDRAKVGKKLHGVPVVGGRETIIWTVKLKRIDEIIVAIPSANKKEVNEILAECAKTCCKVKILPSVCQLIDGSVVMQKVRNVDIEDLLGRESVKIDLDEISSYFCNQVVLVTGGGGSIGSELCRQIAALKPGKLVILDNYENNAFEIQNELLGKYPELNLSVVIANIREKQRIDNIFKKYKPDMVFHAAAHKHVPLMEENPTEAIKNNVFGTLNMAECADKYGAKKFVLISTDKAVNPTNVMGATKRIAEMIVQATDLYSKTEFAAVRFGNVLGSNGSVIPIFKKQIEQGGPVTVTHPEITRYFMTIPEAVQLVLQAGVMAQGGEIFVLDMGKPVKICDLARNLIRLSGFEPDQDIKIEFTGLRPGEKLYEELLMAEEGLQATKNESIFVAPSIFTDIITLKREINKLNDIIGSNTEEIINYIPVLVPTYKRTI